MARIYLESTQIPNVIYPAINKGINKMNKALGYLNSTSAPSGYGGSLSNKKDRINSIIRELEDIKSWLASTTRQLNNFETSAKESAQQLPKAGLSARKQIVK